MSTGSAIADGKLLCVGWRRKVWKKLVVPRSMGCCLD